MIVERMYLCQHERTFDVVCLFYVFDLYMNKVGERLKEERERLQFNQEDFAKLCNSSKRSQGNYERDKRAPDSEYLVLASKLGCDIQYIITGIRSANIESIGKPQLSVVEKPTTLTMSEAIDLVGLCVHEGLHTTYQVRRVQGKLVDLKLDAWESKELITKAAKLFAHCHLTGESPAEAFEKVINEALNEDKQSSA